MSLTLFFLMTHNTIRTSYITQYVRFTFMFRGRNHKMSRLLSINVMGRDKLNKQSSRGLGTNYTRNYTSYKLRYRCFRLYEKSYLFLKALVIYLYHNRNLS